MGKDGLLDPPNPGGWTTVTGEVRFETIEGRLVATGGHAGDRVHVNDRGWLVIQRAPLDGVTIGADVLAPLIADAVARGVLVLPEPDDSDAAILARPCKQCGKVGCYLQSRPPCTACGKVHATANVSMSTIAEVAVCDRACGERVLADDRASRRHAMEHDLDGRPIGRAAEFAPPREQSVGAPGGPVALAIAPHLVEALYRRRELAEPWSRFDNQRRGWWELSIAEAMRRAAKPDHKARRHAMEHDLSGVPMMPRITGGLMPVQSPSGEEAAATRRMLAGGPGSIVALATSALRDAHRAGADDATIRILVAALADSMDGGS